MVKHKTFPPPFSKNRRNFFLPPHFPILLLIVGIISIFVVAQYKGVDFIELDKDGNPTISKARKEKMDREIADLDGAEQYVLLATENTNYPCYSCVNQTTIALKIGQVWKYGVTTKGESGRYKNTLSQQGLFYFKQFEGKLEQCLIEEKKKIYYYPLLPENLARPLPLIRPPGNKQDN